MFTPPNTLVENLRYRSWLLRWAAQNERRRALLMEHCRRDPVFWVNSFIWSNDPRPPDDELRPHIPKTPFILFEPRQREIFMQLLKTSNRDVHFEKSRDVGGTYVCEIVILCEWLLTSYDTQWLVLSRKEDLVDDPNNPSSLFGKLDYMLKAMPSWMAPKDGRLRHQMKLYNCLNQNLIVGESTNQEAGRGGRYKRALLDEWAAVAKADKVAKAVRGATRCRIFLSTPAGKGNHFYEMSLREDLLKLRLHWSDHPDYGKDAYKDENGKLRSPWYDKEVKRMSPLEVASELDIDYCGSTFTYFNDNWKDTVRETVTEPVFEGAVLYKRDADGFITDVSFKERPEGPLKLYRKLEDIQRCRLVNSSDLSMGTGASNSCTVWIDRSTNEVVAEYVTPFETPDIFCERVWAASSLLSPDVKWIWESNGPGRIFASRLTDMNSPLCLSPNQYYIHRQEFNLEKNVSSLPGWASNPDLKLMLFDYFRSAVLEKLFTLRQRQILLEADNYCWVKGQTAPEYVAPGASVDPSGARANHGDRVLACVIAWHYIRILEKPEEEPPPPKVIPVSSLAARMELMEDEDDEYREEWR